jgi:hypothetical protein
MKNLDWKLVRRQMIGNMVLTTFEADIVVNKVARKIRKVKVERI